MMNQTTVILILIQLNSVDSFGFTKLLYWYKIWLTNNGFTSTDSCIIVAIFSIRLIDVIPESEQFSWIQIG